MKVGKYYLNREEPCISGRKGCGVVYLSGCNMRCVYCLVGDISWEGQGMAYTREEFAELLIRLQHEGASHILISNAEPQLSEVTASLQMARERGCTIPFLNNNNGYATVAQLRKEIPLFDGFVMDIKYGNDAIGERLSGVRQVTQRMEDSLSCLSEAYGPNRSDENGLLIRGVLLRHLLLPGEIENTKEVLRWLRNHNPCHYPVELMNHFVPEWKTFERMKGPFRVSPEEVSDIRRLASCYGIPVSN